MDDYKLVVAVQCRRLLYDKVEPEYSNRDLVRRAWRDVAKEVGTDVETAKRRWVQLRDYFMRLLRTGHRTRSGKTVCKRRKWVLFDAMTFLVPYVRPRESWNVLDESVVHMANNGGASMDTAANAMSPLESPEPKVFFEQPSVPDVSAASWTEFVETPEIHSLGAMKKETELVAPVVENIALKTSDEVTTMDENEHFFKSLIPMIRQLEPIRAMEFRFEVQGLLLRFLKEAK